MRRPRLLREEEGISFVEMIVAMAISAIVGTLLIAAMSMVTRVDRFTRQDSQVLGELRTATERFQKEMRQGRKIYADSTGTSVHFWVDYNRNNQQDNAEKLIWRLETVSGKTRLVRTSDAGETPFIEAVDLVSGTAFTYSPGPPATTVVTITLTGDVSSGNQPSARTVRTKVRLRNAAA